MYHTLTESTRSLPTSEVKQPRAWLALWWGTAWEDQGAASFCPHFFPLPQRQIMPPWPGLRLQDNNIECTKNLLHFPICACHPCAGAMLLFSASIQFYRMFPEGNPHRLAENEVTTLLGILQSYPRQSVPRFFHCNHLCHRSHFGSRYSSGRCNFAVLFGATIPQKKKACPRL